MSDPKTQRADGCSIFFSLAIGALLIASFYFFEKFAAEDSVSDPNSIISNKRKDSIEKFNANSISYSKKIDEFHNDRNSSLEEIMSRTINSYKSKPDKSN